MVRYRTFQLSEELGVRGAVRGLAGPEDERERRRPALGTAFDCGPTIRVCNSTVQPKSDFIR